MTSELRKGSVIHTQWPKGYAFLRDAITRREYFFHTSQIIGTRPQVGDPVVFRIGDYNGKPVAIEVKLAEPTDTAKAILSGDGGAQ